MLIITKNTDGLFVASEQIKNEVHSLECTSTDREGIIKCLASKGYPLIDIYDALYIADPEVRKLIDSQTEEMRERLKNTKYFETFSKKP